MEELIAAEPKQWNYEREKREGTVNKILGSSAEEKSGVIKKPVDESGKINTKLVELFAGRRWLSIGLVAAMLLIVACI